MFKLLKRKSKADLQELPPIHLGVSAITTVDEAGVLYLNSCGEHENLGWYDAYKGWCKSKGVKRSKPRYVCDRTRAEGGQIIFYTNPKIIFTAADGEEQLWAEILNKITSLGFASFDWD